MPDVTETAVVTYGGHGSTISTRCALTGCGSVSPRTELGYAEGPFNDGEFSHLHAWLARLSHQWLRWLTRAEVGSS